MLDSRQDYDAPHCELNLGMAWNWAERVVGGGKMKCAGVGRHEGGPILHNHWKPCSELRHKHYTSRSRWAGANQRLPPPLTLVSYFRADVDMDSYSLVEHLGKTGYL